jgi:hypothetical protein
MQRSRGILLGTGPQNGAVAMSAAQLINTPFPLRLALCAGGLRYLGDLCVYDPAAMVWTDLSNAADGVRPSARYGHGFTAAGGRLYVHAGYSDMGELCICVWRGEVWVEGRVMEGRGKPSSF